MQSTEDLVSKGFEMVGKIADAKKAEAEAAKAEPPAEAASPNQPVETEAHEVEPDEPWYSPHHWMHHGGTITTAASIIVVAFLGYMGIRYKHKKKLAK